MRNRSVSVGSQGSRLENKKSVQYYFLERVQVCVSSVIRDIVGMYRIIPTDRLDLTIFRMPLQWNPPPTPMSSKVKEQPIILLDIERMLCHDAVKYASPLFLGAIGCWCLSIPINSTNTGEWTRVGSAKILRTERQGRKEQHDARNQSLRELPKGTVTRYSVQPSISPSAPLPMSSNNSEQNEADVYEFGQFHCFAILRRLIVTQRR
jgi:hypothetical protein